MKHTVLSKTEPAGGWLRKKRFHIHMHIHFISLVAPFTDLPIPTPSDWKRHSGTEAWHSRGTTWSDQTIGANASEGVGRRSVYDAADGLSFPLFGSDHESNGNGKGASQLRLAGLSFRQQVSHFSVVLFGRRVVDVSN